MTLNRLRRPTPIQVSLVRAKRQEAGLGAVGPGSEEGPEPSDAAEGPESPDSPGSSPSTTGAPSPSDSEDSEDDEPPSPKNSTSSASQPSSIPTVTSSTIPLPSSTTTQSASTILSPPSQTTSIASASASSSSTPNQVTISTSTSRSSPSFTLVSTSRGIGAVVPQPTDPVSATVVTSVRATSRSSLASSASLESIASPLTRSLQVSSSRVTRPSQPATTTTSMLPPPTNVSGVPAGEDDSPRRTRPQPTIMSKGAEAAAITLSIIGAIALVVGILLYCKRRRRRRNEKLEAELEHDAANHAALQHPESAHINNATMTQFSDSSNRLFGAGSYSRPETVSTRDGSRIPMPQPTPNPFADPPLNKAYDVLAGRPRSTTLTDRGSWVKNPFRDPESERFDPFGELQAKARRERVKQVELARREAELKKQFEEKEKMGLAPPQRALDRKGSGVTLEGLGVLDRSGGGAYL